MKNLKEIKLETINSFAELALMIMDKEIKPPVMLVHGNFRYRLEEEHVAGFLKGLKVANLMTWPEDLE